MTPLDFAHLPDVSGPLYGFNKARQGSPHGVELGFSVRKTPYQNCVTVVMSYIARVAPRDCDLKTWQIGMLNTSDRRGPCQAAVLLGMAQDVTRLEAGDHLEAGWYVAQGWAKSGGGHAVFLHVLPGAKPSQILILEARGQTNAAGGPYKGQDGASSRCCTPPNVRDWPAGRWAEVHRVLDVDYLLSKWPECHVAKLLI
jgi:hypothetical protein